MSCCHVRRGGTRAARVPVDPLDEHVIRRVFGASPLPAPDELPSFELDDVIAWACRRGIATTAELRQLVAARASPAATAPQRGPGWAARFGVHERTLRRHRDRALAALRAAADDYAAEDDAVRSVARVRAAIGRCVMAPTCAATASAPSESWPGAHTTDWPGPVGQRRPAMVVGEEVEVVSGAASTLAARLSVVELQAVLRAARRRAAWGQRDGAATGQL